MDIWFSIANKVVLHIEYKSCTIKKQLFDLVVEVKGHSEFILIHDTLPCPNTYTFVYIKYDSTLP